VGGAGPQTPSYREILDTVKTRGGIQGFCTGLLTALAVASSPDEETLVEVACQFVRLAACIGAYIDLDPGFTCLGVKCRPEHNGVDGLKDALQEFPEVRVSAGLYTVICADSRLT
jgi:hypothetical protein